MFIRIASPRPASPNSVLSHAPDMATGAFHQANAMAMSVGAHHATQMQRCTGAIAQMTTATGSMRMHCLHHSGVATELVALFREAIG